jgi:hypothetical protein
VANIADRNGEVMKMKWSIYEILGPIPLYSRKPLLFLPTSSTPTARFKINVRELGNYALYYSGDVI